MYGRGGGGMTPETCPNCKTDLRGEPIPADKRESYGGATRFSRVLAIEYRGEDFCRDWRCPDCGHVWRRK